jgi:hypothetical protein
VSRLLVFTLDSSANQHQDRNIDQQIKHGPGFSPGEIIEVPERVHWKDKIPDGECRKVNKHPKYVNNLSCGNQDEDSGESDDGKEEHEWDGLFERIGRVEYHADNERIRE